MIKMAFYSILLFAQDSSVQVDTTAAGYKVGLYLGSFLPFIGLLIVFLIIIRSSYRMKNKK